MATMPWFRLYSEFLTDPLIRMLAFEDQRHFIAALCMKASGVTDKRYVTSDIRRHVISQLIGLSDVKGEGAASPLDAANARLRKLGLVDEDWNPTNWNKRQFVSDHQDRTAAERMRRYRSKRNVTDVTPVVTAVDTEQIQNRTDTEQKSPLPPEGLDLEAWYLWQSYRKLKPKSVPLAMKKLAAFGADQLAVVEQSIANGWQGLFALKAASEASRKPLKSWQEIEAEERARANYGT